MPSIKSLDVSGFKNLKIPNMYFDFSSDQLAILLPGLAYTNDSPIFYYTGSYLMLKQINILRVDYKYVENENYLNSSKNEQKQWLIEDVRGVVEKVLSEQKFKRILLIGKSIGTIALGEILLSIVNLKEADAIWLTPLLNNDELVEKILKIKNRSLLIMGTEDYAYKPDNLKRILEKKNVESLIIQGANHSFQIDNNIVESIYESQKILEKIMSFVDEERN